MKLENKVAIVTGGGQGIGRAISGAFCREGAAVVIAEVDEEAGEEAASEIARAGGRCIFIRTDVSDEDSVKNMITAARAAFGGLHILCNNAGIFDGGSIYTTDMATWDRVIAVNLRGAYMCAKYAAPVMRDGGGGVIINIASTRALMSEPDTEPYSASKGGILALTHALAISLGRDGIRVNAISPGWIDVTGWKKKSARRPAVLTPQDHAQHPVGRVGRPEDVARACVFLASDDAGFITGANLVVDGGMTVKMIYV
ncbi:MAG TPA: glucose 1-dehydrogenase [Firmicutes bacterium]|nr:glucose 1-dehydrogenase [Bacillota bacterium]